MATKNAPFYSRRPGDNSEIKSHRTEKAALAAAKECGQIWHTEHKKQWEVCMTAAGVWGVFKPSSLAVNMQEELRKQGLI